MNGVMVIVVTMFAILGAYYLSGVFTSWLFGRKSLENAVVVFTANSMEDVWSSALDLRHKMPNVHIVVLYDQKNIDTKQLEVGLEHVLFATPEALKQTVCQVLSV